MRLTDEESAMLAGAHGPARQWAIKHQVAVGDFFDARQRLDHLRPPSDLAVEAREVEQDIDIGRSELTQALDVLLTRAAATQPTSACV